MGANHINFPMTNLWLFDPIFEPWNCLTQVNVLVSPNIWLELWFGSNFKLFDFLKYWSQIIELTFDLVWTGLTLTLTLSSTTLIPSLSYLRLHWSTHDPYWMFTQLCRKQRRQSKDNIKEMRPASDNGYLRKYRVLTSK